MAKANDRPWEVGETVVVKGRNGSVILTQRIDDDSGQGWRGWWVNHGFTIFKDDQIKGIY